ncbi:non-specific serine/threonine protein kinase [Salvia divinorum]|uniref:Non-specific serine/threonine protein kinase n=1 Tax=Salvia divinorum TaxID=28513 RepID=A0ABD1HY10_SALDI
MNGDGHHLKQKTGEFGSIARIGQGSRGGVYFMQLNDGKEVAVKKLDVSGSNVEFLTQVSMVSRSKHDNVVELLGYCVDGNVRDLFTTFCMEGKGHNPVPRLTGCIGLGLPLMLPGDPVDVVKALERILSSTVPAPLTS